MTTPREGAPAAAAAATVLRRLSRRGLASDVTHGRSASGPRVVRAIMIAAPSLGSASMGRGWGDAQPMTLAWGLGRRLYHSAAWNLSKCLAATGAS